mmetsp:Transcript_159071/g.506670  ORF Transcript_159071/g.506670 Transcript_159071/m.506670 type:complete len:101 (-) Transcript_159071:137-439(-)
MDGGSDWANEVCANLLSLASSGSGSGSIGKKPQHRRQGREPISIRAPTPPAAAAAPPRRGAAAADEGRGDENRSEDNFADCEFYSEVEPRPSHGRIKMSL